MADLLIDLSDLITAVDEFTFLKFFSFCSAQVFQLRLMLASKDTHHEPYGTQSVQPKIIIFTSEGRICSKCHAVIITSSHFLMTFPVSSKTKTINKQENKKIHTPKQAILILQT